MAAYLKNVTWVLALMILLLGCARASPEATPVPSPTARPTTAASSDTCLAHMAVYPESEEEPQMRGELDDWIRSMETMAQAPDGEVMIYGTSDPPGDVVQFYREHPPQGSWERTFDVTSPEEVGIIVWEKGDLRAQMFTSVRGQRTLILLGCGSNSG